MKIDIRQETHYKGKDWWQWSVCLDGPEEMLDRVGHVVYTLHPTFPTPVRQVSDRATNFRLDSAGWGEFEIFVDIVFKNGKHEQKKHWLELVAPAPEKRTVKTRAAEAKAESRGRPSVFLSNSVTDISMTRALRSQLAESGLDVVTINDLAPGVPWEKSITMILKQADVAIFVISERPSPYLQMEIDAALAQNVSHIIPILVGPGAELPEKLSHFQSIQVKTPSEIESVARQIAQASLRFQQS
jgi:hypothetical protein